MKKFLFTVLIVVMGLYLYVTASSGKNVLFASLHEAKITDVMFGESGGTVGVHVSVPEGETALLIASFFGGGGLTGAEMKGLDSETWMPLTFSVPEGAETVKVMLWDGLDGMVPLCAAELGRDYAAPTPTPPPDPDSFHGIRIDPETGRLVPSAHDFGIIETFETGKIPKTEIFISPDGSDSKGDGTRENPYENLLPAINFAMSNPGTAVRIMPGTYTAGRWITGLRGTEEDPIWIGGVPGEDRPVFDMALGGGGSPITLENCSYVIIHDIEMCNTTAAGESSAHGLHLIGQFSGNAETDPYDEFRTHSLVVRGCYIHNIGNSPIKLAAVNYSYFYDNEFADDPAAGRSSGTVDQVGCHGNTIAYNYFHDLTTIGVVNKGGSYDNDIFGNLFVNFGAGVTMGQNTGFSLYRPYLDLENFTTYEARNIRAYSNIFIAGHTTAWFGSATECYFVNNTVINPESYSPQFLFRFLNAAEESAKPYLANGGYCHNDIVSNNIVYHMDSSRYYINIGSGNQAETFVMENNMFFNPNYGGLPNMDAYIPHTGSIEDEDPLFRSYAITPHSEIYNKAAVDFASLDLAVWPKSLAVGYGVNKYDFVKTDFRGRPVGNRPTLGAIQ